MLNRFPQTRYDENVDMTLYNRRDGQRLIIYTDNPKKLELYPERLVNLLHVYHKRQYVDYIICSVYQPMLRSIAGYCGIPTLDYEGDGEFGNFKRLCNQFLAAYPTAAIIFQENDTEEIRILRGYCRDKAIPIEWIAL